MKVRNEYAKRLVADELKKKHENVKFLFNNNDEERFTHSLKTQLGVLGAFEVIEKIGSFSDKWKFFNVFSNYVDNLPTVIKFDDEVEDLFDHWAVFYDERDADGVKRILPAMEAYPPALVDKTTGEVEFVSMSEVKSIREALKKEHKHARVGRTVSLTNTMIDAKKHKI